MIGNIAVINVLAFVLQDRQVHVTDVRARGKHKIALGLLGGLFGIYATISGFPMPDGSIVTIRDFGPLMAGCLGGVYSGLAAGLIAGIHRFCYGLPDVLIGSTIPCAFSTVLIGFLGGFILHKPLRVRRRFAGYGFLTGAGMELLHIGICYLYFIIIPHFVTLDRYVEPWAFLTKTTIPFLVSNGIALTVMFYMMERLNKYKRTSARAKRIKSELDVATRIQQSMLPAIYPGVPDRVELDLSASMHASKNVGGDFYDFFFVDSDHFVFLVGDVSGKGVPASLFMVISKTIIKNNMLAGMSASEAFEKANNQLLEGNKEFMFVTAWMGVLELSTGNLTYVNAGHNPPVLSRFGGDFEFVKERSGFILAGRKDMKYKEFKMTLNAKDRLLIYTDGVTEAMNRSNEQFGEKRLMELMNHHESHSAEGMVNELNEHIKIFADGEEQSDDITILAIRYRGPTSMFQTNVSRKVVECKSENVEVLSQFMEKTLEGRVPPKYLSKANVVIDEIFSNAVKFSGSSDFALEISDIDENATPRSLNLRMVYGGVLYDVLTQPTPPDITLPAAERPIGGLGLFMVKKICSDVTYTVCDGRNVLDAKIELL
ncbi:MAG: SpoIIE family protein phosphatase [Fibrobacter sp.]|nr:SpoIIE family protein phosphatase [Fibrobacter sp.]